MSSGQPYRYRPEPDPTGFMGAIAHHLEQQDPMERATLSAFPPAQAAERIGRDLYAMQTAEKVRRAQEFADRTNRAWESGVMSESQYRAEMGIPEDEPSIVDVVVRPPLGPINAPISGTITLHVGRHQKVLPYNATGKQINDTVNELAELARADQDAERPTE